MVDKRWGQVFVATENSPVIVSSVPYMTDARELVLKRV